MAVSVLSENQYNEKQRSVTCETGSSEGEETRVWKLRQALRDEGGSHTSSAHLAQKLTSSQVNNDLHCCDQFGCTEFACIEGFTVAHVLVLVRLF